ncbi:hypothetical protein Pmar_PMAR016588 [Perkinsus marinus ATCC 50983]|uniref:DUF4833 domain-containing protein n=1 Tax=Perkinsus marinus (strain ATCC 50983 / TXsc) TaxID=423536 RepID=C5KTK9_PERM5|nr:hypothetical protein Pmar_PMAR016588 [Perkinsus marinus ATCC 50983]EER12188.1 hypothetical protein Pmar_PMAR016588 [Perkinsus marinus ATCC 50983]|eukprot:XP_002780393.1 hypothetical protein Pmar_PMAR016588 [Perkinsus marinus ATCC 50983]
MSALKVFEAAPDATGFDNSKRVSLHNMIPAPHDSPKLISRQEKLYDQDAMAFIITRNKNDNTVCYRAKFSRPGVLDKGEPIEAYWMDFVLHSVTREASQVIADRIRDTLSSVYGLKIKTVKLDFRPFEEDPEGSTQCDWCGCDVGRDSNQWEEALSSGDAEAAERSRDRCDRRTIEANQQDRLDAPLPFEETMNWCYACLHKFYPAVSIEMC